MELKLIVKMEFGSHLYGTVTEDSDQDYKGVFLPTKEQVFLGRIPKSCNETTKKGNIDKNLPTDIDTEIYSLHYFIELACQGQTVALDMLHAPDSMILESSIIWNMITTNKEKFYTKDLKAFVGYARRQAAKYGIKGSRLNAARDVVAFLKSAEEGSKLSELWDFLPKGEHIHFLEKKKEANDLRTYQVVGKRFQETARVGYVLPILERFYNEYGKRAQQAAQNFGIDWKAISHAFRAAYQTREILTQQTITFPLKDAPFLKQVKKGELDYLTQVVPVLEELMDEVEQLSEVSTLPQKVNRKYWDKFIIDTLENEAFLDRWR